MLLGQAGGELDPLKGSERATRETNMNKTLPTVSWSREGPAGRQSIADRWDP